MDITFILGNGFDIGLGMPTRYEDFYKEYCQIKAEDNDNIREFKEMLVNRNSARGKKIINWADFEKAFGEHSKDLNDKRDYLEQFENFVEAFNLYLERVESFVDFSNTSAIAKVMDTAVETFYHIRPADKSEISEIINQNGSERVYNFITFNYTRTLDKCVEAFQQLIAGDENRKIGSVTHIHGFIDQNMIVGVNDAGQIPNEEFASDREVLHEIIKPLQNTISRTGYEYAMKSVIRKSQLICIYGMSIGETDRKWWDEILNWLAEDPYRILVILIHESKFNPRFPHRQDRYIRPVIDRFLPSSDIDDKVKRIIEERIYVGVNNDVFAMNLYHASEGEKTGMSCLGDTLKAVNV